MIKPTAFSVLALSLAASCGEADRPVSIEVWHGDKQRVGHLGDAQDDFNLMGIASGNEFTYAVNGGAPVPLTVPFEPWGFRRLGGEGHFNADIPIDSMEIGVNTVVIAAKSGLGDVTKTVEVERVEAENVGLPHRIDWSAVEHPQDVGQLVDGQFAVTESGLLSKEPMYDRLFLVGNRSWQDYEVTTSMTIGEIPAENAPMSGGSGVGVILRFTGHSVSPPRFPEAQPKWGYQPFGAILWLRWSKTAPEDAPVRQFYRGDKDGFENHAAFDAFTPGMTVRLRASCQTDPEDAAATTYRLKLWADGDPEPEAWDYEEIQRADEANKRGGFALVAHHVTVTFGDVTVEPR